MKSFDTFNNEKFIEFVSKNNSAGITYFNISETNEINAVKYYYYDNFLYIKDSLNTVKCIKNPLTFGSLDDLIAYLRNEMENKEFMICYGVINYSTNELYLIYVKRQTN